MLFVVSALIGVWASYDTATSWRKFAMIIAAVALYYVLVALRGAPQLIKAFVWLFLFGCCALTLYFVTQHDYAAQPGKFGFITAIGLILNHAAPQLGLHVFDPNITSGALEIGLPLGVAVASGQWPVNSRQNTEHRTQNTEHRVQNTLERASAGLGMQKAKGTPAPADVARERQNVISLSPGLLVAWSICVFIGFGLVMTSSRGAWLALVIVGGIAVLAVAARDVLRRYALPIGVITVLVALIALMRLGDAFVPMLENVLGTIPAGDTAISRVELLGQAWGLVQDYYFTGSGLGVFPMILSTYALLIDVPFLTHVHNLFLQVWLEQGLLGLVALVWLVFEFYLWAWKTVGRRQRSADSDTDPLPSAQHMPPRATESSMPDAAIGSLSHWLMWGGVAAATVMLLHGMVDVLLYSSRGLPLMLVPFGIAGACGQMTEHRIQTTQGESQMADGGRQLDNWKPGTWSLKLGVVLLIVFGLFLSSFIPHPSSFMAMWYANLGSVEQTRVELGQYHWPDRLVGDVRSGCQLPATGCKLNEAEDYFRQALALDPGNVTANQRLAAIALAQGSYDDAQAMLSQAYRRDPSNDVTNRLLGLYSNR
jgi:hypothetical protein